MKQNGGYLQNIMQLVYWIVKRCEVHHFVRMSSSLYNKPFISVESFLQAFILCVKGACILWNAISPKPIICAQHTWFTFKLMCSLHAFQYYKTSGLKG